MLFPLAVIATDGESRARGQHFIYPSNFRRKGIMGELTDFLVWLQREQKAGRYSVSTVKVVGSAAFDYLASLDKILEFPISEGQAT